MATPFQLVIVTPEATVLESTVDYVSITADDGELGIMAHHSPLIARLGFGELRMSSNGKTERLYVDGGFAQIADNVVSVLTGQTLKLSEIDAAQVRGRLEDAESRRGTDAVDEAQRRRTINQSRAQLRMTAKRE